MIDFQPIQIRQPSFAEINERNRKFWERKSRLADACVAAEGISQKGVRDLKLEGEPIRSARPTNQRSRAVCNSETRHVTARQYLETHSVTRKLLDLGVTNEQLQVIRFRGTNRGLPFDQLKWLVLEDPPYSRDKDDAWRLLSEVTAAPTYAIGERARESQSQRAKRPRGKITDDGKTINQAIEGLALKPKYREERAKELWPHFMALLDREGLNPKEMVDAKDSEKWTYEYDFKSGRKQISFCRFESIVSRARTRKKSR